MGNGSNGTERRDEQLLNILGLAYRARRCAIGTDAAIDEIRQGRAKLVLIARDAGSNVEKKIRDKTHTFSVALHSAFTKTELGLAVGRSRVVVAAVTDPGFAEKMLAYIGEFDGGDAFDQTQSV